MHDKEIKRIYNLMKIRALGAIQYVSLHGLMRSNQGYINFCISAHFTQVAYRNQVWVRVLSRQNLARVIQTGHLLHEA